jgi:hypothetical protein
VISGERYAVVSWLRWTIKKLPGSH